MRQKSFKPISSNLTSSARERGIFFFFFPFFSLSWREQNVLKATGRQEERGLSPNDMVYDCNLGVCVYVCSRERASRVDGPFFNKVLLLSPFGVVGPVFPFLCPSSPLACITV